MDFTHSEERRLLSNTIEKFIANDYPLSHRMINASSDLGFSLESWKKLNDLGINYALFSEQFNGFGGEGFDIAVVFEALGKGLVVEPFLSTLMGGDILSQSNVHKDILELLMTGEKRITFAHFEPHSGYESDIKTVQTTNGITGVKSMVQSANGVDFIIISAKDKDDLKLYLVETNTAGLKMTDYKTIDGGRAAELFLDDVTGVELNIDAKNALESAIGKGILALSSEALGIMEFIKSLTINYLQTRSQFGLQLGKFQALQHRAAQMLLEIEQTRSAVINACSSLNKKGKAREMALSACKMTIGRVGQIVAEEAIQLHGGIGMTWEYELGHYAKRLIMIDHELGDEDFHTARYSKYL